MISANLIASQNPGEKPVPRSILVYLHSWNNWVMCNFNRFIYLSLTFIQKNFIGYLTYDTKVAKQILKHYKIADLC